MEEIDPGDDDEQTIFDATGITADVESSSQEIPSSVSGAIDTIKTDQIGTVKLTPCGQLVPSPAGVIHWCGVPSEIHGVMPPCRCSVARFSA